MASWLERWVGSDGSPWPSRWATAGDGTARILGGQGRLETGSAPAAALRARFEEMSAQQDVELLLDFTPRTALAWFLTLGTRTQNNAAALGDEAFTPRGEFVQITNFFGSHADFIRHGDDGGHVILGSTTALPAFTAGVTYRVRFRVDGPILRIRVWRAADPEPTVWSFEVTDPAPYLSPGKITLGFTTDFAGGVEFMDFDNLTVAALYAQPGPVVQRSHSWSMWSRGADYALTGELPIASAQMVLRHLGVSRAVITTPYSEAAYEALQPSNGVVLYRDSRQEFSGQVGPLELDWDEDSGRVVIKADCVGDEQHLADRLVFPDPLRAADDQTVNDYWTYAGVASTAMRQLISDQAGPTCRVDRRVPGLVLGADPGVGLSRTWQAALFVNVLEQLTTMSVASGEDLGIRTSTAASALTVDIVQPRDLVDAVKFSVEFGNVAGINYRVAPPTVTHALSAGQGDLHTRLRKAAVTASSLALSWGRQVWSYIDRRDTADPAELAKANDDALADGDATVALSATLLDSDAATYGVDWWLGDRVTVFVRVPGQSGAVATVSDVIREIAISVDEKGTEKIRPAIGTWDAKAIVPTPSQQELARVADGLAGLIARK